MRRLSTTAALLLALAFSGAAVAQGQGQAQSQPQISISPDRDVIIQGEPFTLTIRVSSKSADEPVVRLPSFGGLRILSQSEKHPMSFSFSFGTGQGSQRVTKRDSIYEFVLVADRSGKYQLNPVIVEVSGQRYKSKAYTLNVSASSSGGTGQAMTPDPSGGTVPSAEPLPASPPTVDVAGDAVDPDYFIDMVASKEEVVTGEMLTLTVYLYTSWRIGGVHLTREPGTEGFWAETIDTSGGRHYSNQEQVNVGGRNYERVELRKLALFPIKAGEFTVAPAIAELEVRRGGFFSSAKKVRRTARPLTLKVSPLPEEGKPADFVSTNVGRFTFRVDVDNTQVKVGEPVTVKSVVRGTGNLHNVALPPLEEVMGFKVYAPEVVTDVNASANAVQGTRTSEILMIPREAGDFTIPSLSLSFFDPREGAYRTIKSKPHKITVLPGDQAGQAAAAGPSATPTGEMDDDLVRLNKQLRSIVSTANLKRNSETLPFHRAWFVAPTILAPLAFLALVVVARVRRKARENQQKGRTKRAEATALKSLSTLSKTMGEGSSAEFFAALQKILLVFLDDKLETPVAGDTMAELATRLESRGVAPADASRAVTELEGCEFARFARETSDSAERKRAMDRMRELIGDLNRAALTPPPKEETR